MNIYSVYTDSSEKIREPILIKQGFSFIAGLLSFFWAIYHKMWSVALVIFIFNLLVKSIDSSYIAYCINFAILFTFSFFASEIREYYALKKGHNLSDIILATNEEEAEVKYYSRIKNLEVI